MSGNGHGEGGRALRRSEGLFPAEGLLGGPLGSVVGMGGKDRRGKGGIACVAPMIPTARTEMEAIRAAARPLGSFTRAGGDLYTSAQPCPLCWGEAYWARIVRV